MIISFIGLPGCGKTTLGKKLSQLHSIPFFDLDLVIEHKFNKSISMLFNEYSENGFREIEKTVLEDIFKTQTNSIIALGGGTPCFFDNMEMINKYSESYYLNVPINIIVERLLSKLTNRPLFNNITTDIELHNKLTELLNIRKPFYLRAKHVLNYPFELDDIKF